MPKFDDDFLNGLTVEPGKRDRLVFDSDVRGLGVRVTAKSKTFLVQWTDPATKQKQREVLDRWGNITVKAARTAAQVKLGEVAKGNNPRDDRLKRKEAADQEREERALTVDKLLSDWAALHLAKRRPRYAAEAQRAVRFAFKDLLSKPAARITKKEVVNILDGLVKAGKTTIASRTMAYGRAAYSWALKRGKVDANPFAGLPIATANSERERVLSEGEVREVWAITKDMTKPVGQFMRIALLTLSRRDEVAGMRWSEISTDGTDWVIPGLRTKNGKPHVVHLSDAALEVLEGVDKVEDQDLVFSTTGKTSISGFAKFKKALDAGIVAERAEKAIESGTKAEPLVPFVVHDFRRTGVSTLAALGFDSIVADKLLNHQPGKLRGVAAVYQRHEFGPERARALDAWANYVTGVTAEVDNIHRMQAA